MSSSHLLKAIELPNGDVIKTDREKQEEVRYEYDCYPIKEPQVVFYKNKKEISSYNPRYIARIDWWVD